jgi:glucose-1-phosphate thymidylyltransferase
MKGIILAGGTGTRLYPITKGISKQLMPIYNKPMIYYPLSTLMESGIREILIITTPHDQASFINLLGDGSEIGCKITYKVQPNPEGLAQAFIIGEEFIGNDSVCLLLGDNIFYGTNLKETLQSCVQELEGGIVFAYQVSDSSSYGVVEFDENYKAISIEEKPTNPKSDYAVPGIYFYDNKVIQYAKDLKPSSRGELEITGINNRYLEEGTLNVKILDTGTAWLDTGTFESMNHASQFVQVIEERQGIKVGCIEEIAYKNGWISEQELNSIANPLVKSGYGKYLLNLLKNKIKPKLIVGYKNILVTGGCGFIGSNFLNKYVPLFPNINFVNVDVMTYAANENNVHIKDCKNYKFYKTDIRNLEELDSIFEENQIDAVIHFAAESHVDLSIANPSLFVEVNVNGTSNLLELSKKYKIKRFHHVSTDEVYGELSDEGFFTENTPLAPNSPYSASKASSDMIVRAYNKTYGLNCVITRCSNNYGPNQDLTKLIPKFITNLEAGKKVPVYATGSNVRDWLYVEDHCDAIWKVFNDAKSGEVYNIGGNNEKTNMAITNKLIELTGKNSSSIEYVTDRLGHDFRYAIDASKIKNDLGWEPQYTFDIGIQKTFEFYSKKKVNPILDGLKVIEGKIFEDNRGYFTETFNQANYRSLGIDTQFIQDNESVSKYGVIRGLHYQTGEYAQAKLVRVIEGEVLDVVVDLRKNSVTYGKTYSMVLSDKNKKQMFIPKGFAHGFSVLSTTAKFAYKVDNVYNKESEAGINPLDSNLNIDWLLPKDMILIGDKDLLQPNFEKEISDKKKLLILGSNGQLGQCFRKQSILYPEFDYVFATRNDVNVTNYESLEEYINSINPDFIINCIAYTAVDKAESEIEQAYLINAKLPKNLAILSTKYNCKLIHISTDYVYNSEQGEHTENSVTNPCNVYGASKLKGDKNVIICSQDGIVIRTSWVYSDFGNNFLLTMIKLMKDKTELTIINDQIGSPTSGYSIVDAILKLIPQYSKVKRENRVFNFSDNGIISWYDFAVKIQKLSGFNNCKLIPSPTSDYKTIAKRPLNSRMSKELFTNTFDIGIQYWELALQKVI